MSPNALRNAGAAMAIMGMSGVGVLVLRAASFWLAWSACLAAIILGLGIDLLGDHAARWHEREVEKLRSKHHL